MTKVEELEAAVNIEIDRLVALQSSLRAFIKSRSGPSRLPNLKLPQPELPTSAPLPMSLKAVRTKKRKYTKKSKFWGKKKK